MFKYNCIAQIFFQVLHTCALALMLIKTLLSSLFLICFSKAEGNFLLQLRLLLVKKPNLKSVLFSLKTYFVHLFASSNSIPLHKILVFLDTMTALSHSNKSMVLVLFHYSFPTFWLYMQQTGDRCQGFLWKKILPQMPFLDKVDWFRLKLQIDACSENSSYFSQNISITHNQKRTLFLTSKKAISSPLWRNFKTKEIEISDQSRHLFLTELLWMKGWA